MGFRERATKCFVYLNSYIQPLQQAIISLRIKMNDWFSCTILSIKATLLCDIFEMSINILSYNNRERSRVFIQFFLKEREIEIQTEFFKKNSVFSTTRESSTKYDWGKFSNRPVIIDHQPLFAGMLFKPTFIEKIQVFHTLLKFFC